MKEETKKIPLTLEQQAALVAVKLEENVAVVFGWEVDSRFLIMQEFADAAGQTLNSAERSRGKLWLDNPSDKLDIIIAEQRQMITDMFGKPPFSDYGAGGFIVFDGGSGQWQKVHQEIMMREQGN